MRIVLVCKCPSELSQQQRCMCVCVFVCVCVRVNINFFMRPCPSDKYIYLSLVQAQKSLFRVKMCHFTMVIIVHVFFANGECRIQTNKQLQ